MFSRLVQLPGMHLFEVASVAFNYKMGRVFAWFKETPCFTCRPAWEQNETVATGQVDSKVAKIARSHMFDYEQFTIIYVRMRFGVVSSK